MNHTILFLVISNFISILGIGMYVSSSTQSTQQLDTKIQELESNVLHLYTRCGIDETEEETDETALW